MIHYIIDWWLIETIFIIIINTGIHVPHHVSILPSEFKPLILGRLACIFPNCDL